MATIGCEPSRLDREDSRSAAHLASDAVANRMSGPIPAIRSRAGSRPPAINGGPIEARSTLIVPPDALSQIDGPSRGIGEGAAPGTNRSGRWSGAWMPSKPGAFRSRGSSRSAAPDRGRSSARHRAQPAPRSGPSERPGSTGERGRSPHRTGRPEPALVLVCIASDGRDRGRCGAPVAPPTAPCWLLNRILDEGHATRRVRSRFRESSAGTTTMSSARSPSTTIRGADNRRVLRVRRLGRASREGRWMDGINGG